MMGSAFDVTMDLVHTLRRTAWVNVRVLIKHKKKLRPFDTRKKLVDNIRLLAALAKYR